MVDIIVDNFMIMCVDNFEDIWGYNMLIFCGIFLEFYFGVGFLYCVVVFFNILMVFDVNISLLDVGIVGIDIIKMLLEVK